MIRVRYDSGDGPYKDPLGISNMQGPVKVYEHFQSGFRHLVVESYHRIGRYHLLNRWIFRHDGLILPQLYSAGLQHNATHQHHVYWRFDFDIDGSANNLALPHWGSNDWGYGPGWMPLKRETIQGTGAADSWAVLNKAGGLAYVINRGPNDKPSDAFESADMYAVVYHGVEDRKGALGTPWSSEIGTHINNGNIDGTEFEWHVVGPLLWPLRY